MSKPRVYGDYYAAAADAPRKLKRYVRWSNTGKAPNGFLAGIVTGALLLILVLAVPVGDSPMPIAGKVGLIVFWCACCVIAGQQFYSVQREYMRRQLRREALSTMHPAKGGQKVIQVNSKFCASLGAVVVANNNSLWTLESLLAWCEVHCFAEFAELNYLASALSNSEASVDADDFSRRCGALYARYQEYHTM